MARSSLPTSPPRTLLRPPRRWEGVDLQELWAYREVLYTLVWRDLKVRYKQTLLGASWAVLQPLVAMVIFTVVFGRFARLPSEGVPYSLFSYTALVPWFFFANALNQASNSLVAHQHVVTKLYFPRLLLPISAVLPGLVDFLVASVALVAMLAWHGYVPTAAVWLTPCYLLLAAAAALGCGLWLAALYARFRDVRFVIPFLVQVWMFASPVVYSTGMVPERWRLLYAANPMASVLEGFRGALLGTPHASLAATLVSCLVTAVLLAGGLFYFRSTERVLADVI